VLGTLLREQEGAAKPSKKQPAKPKKAAKKTAAKPAKKPKKAS
jgi:hypothetical protein